ncbi:MAG: class I SAM-dependent methyltransferase [Thermoplasmata archaeon]|nr:class I SAM-dependent methyltransferase [Thermoplasmata archaeon]
MKIVYDGEDRFISYWHQIDNLMKLNPGEILEIGVGNRFLSKYLIERGVNILTIDFDGRLLPSVEATVLNLPFKDNCFDVIAAFEVLEHLPYEYFIMALKEIKRVTRKYVVLSLPDVSRIFFLTVNISGLFKREMKIPFPSKLKQEVHQYNGEHFWEIGKKKFEFNRIKKDISLSGLKILDTYRIKKEPYFRFFTLEKPSSPDLFP